MGRRLDSFPLRNIKRTLKTNPQTKILYVLNPLRTRNSDDATKHLFVEILESAPIDPKRLKVELCRGCSGRSLQKIHSLIPYRQACFNPNSQKQMCSPQPSRCSDHIPFIFFHQNPPKYGSQPTHAKILPMLLATYSQTSTTVQPLPVSNFKGRDLQLYPHAPTAINSSRVRPCGDRRGYKQTSWRQLPAPFCASFAYYVFRGKSIPQVPAVDRHWDSLWPRTY